MSLKEVWNAEPPYEGNSRLLRRVLLGNAAFSTLTGFISILDAATLTRAFAIPDEWLLPSLGIQLLLFASAIVWVTTRPKLPMALVWTIIGLDIAWVVGSAALLPFVSDTLSAAGISALILIALGVSGFAGGQIAGIRRLQSI